MTENLRDAYFPGTKEMGRNEMIVFSLGTGMSNLRLSQASAAWLLEFGNNAVN
jgi:hypothetical protein